MKKILLLAAVSLALFSCEDKDPPMTGGPNYPTDNLNLDRKRTSLLMQGFSTTSTLSASLQVAAKVMESRFGDSLNHIALSNDPMDFFYREQSDTIHSNFMSPMLPYFIADNEEAPLEEVEMAIRMELMEKPIMAVNHKVSTNDTAHVIDVKVQFYDDTLSSGIFVETYLLGKVPAEVYGTGANETDLRIGAAGNFIKNTDLKSFWDTDFPNYDSTGNVITKGQAYFHDNIVIDQFANSHTYGTRLSDYWSFGGQYTEGDVIGTEFTPIRHYFLKSAINKKKYPVNPKFLTVVWILNSQTQQYMHLTSVMTDLEDDD